MTTTRASRHYHREKQFWIARWLSMRLLLALWLALLIVAISWILSPMAVTAKAAPLATATVPEAQPESVAVAPAQPGIIVQARISHYWPAWGGVNCFSFVAGECVSRTSSGERWQDWIGRGAACPKSWPFWTTFTLPGGEQFTCVDRGGAIVYGEDGIPFLDLLVEHAPVPFGTVVDVVVIWP